MKDKITEAIDLLEAEGLIRKYNDSAFATVKGERKVADIVVEGINQWCLENNVELGFVPDHQVDIFTLNAMADYGGPVGVLLVHGLAKNMTVTFLH